MKTLKDELEYLQQLIENVNKGNKAFWEIHRKYKDIVRTKLGKDENLGSYYDDNIDSPGIRSALGNDLELAIGIKQP